jgi:hypothetical protein
MDGEIEVPQYTVVLRVFTGVPDTLVGFMSHQTEELKCILIVVVRQAVPSRKTSRLN